MKAIEITSPGGPEVLRLAERPIPSPNSGEVLIKVAASGINRPDVLQRTGRYPPPPGTSDILGLEVSGEIVAGDFSGDNPFNLKLNDAVCALLTGGGYAEYTVVPLEQCLPVPDSVGLAEAAALPETFFTVWSNVFDIGRLGRGADGSQESLLVHGGSSGIGVAAIQIARALGHVVFATAGNERKCRACEKLGASAIDYRKEDFVERVLTLTRKRGVDVVLDMVAGEYVSRNVDVLAEGGRLVIIATLGGTSAALDLRTVMRRRLTLTGSLLRPRSTAFKAAIARELHNVVWPLIKTGRVRPIVHEVFAAEDVVKAHALLESGAHIGKILLRWPFAPSS
jgi:NADPH2:quinone reductase